MRRWLPDSLAGRTTAVLLLSLAAFHLGSTWLYQLALDTGLGSAWDRQLTERIVSISRALDRLEPEQRDDLAHSLSTGSLDVHWDEHSLVAREQDGERVRLLRRALDEAFGGRIRLGYADRAQIQLEHVLSTELLIASFPLSDGSWLNFHTPALSTRADPSHAGLLYSTTAMAIGIVLSSLILVRSIAAPLQRLAAAADRFGRSGAAPDLPETGPREVRQAAAAFNRMQHRIEAVVREQVQMLAAVSHDLKTPMTRLRLRAEFVAEDDMRERIGADLDEMEVMIGAALAYLRGDAGEAARKVDLTTTLETICGDLADAGHRVHLDAAPATLIGRPVALKRAFVNLLDNAVRYGGSATVTLREEADRLRIVIEDEGPGIPAQQLEQVFSPFYRLDESRSREGGGTGLGLTVARAIVRGHGGDIALSNREAGGRGLQVDVTLPRMPPEAAAQRG